MWEVACTGLLLPQESQARSHIMMKNQSSVLREGEDFLTHFNTKLQMEFGIYWLLICCLSALIHI